jgi:hypothetical protein
MYKYRSSRCVARWGGIGTVIQTVAERGYRFALLRAGTLPPATLHNVRGDPSLDYIVDGI